MLIYCLNNPVSYYDPNGKWTISIGFGFSGYFFGGSSYSTSISFDSSGNIAIQTTKADAFKDDSGATLGIASIGVSSSITVTNQDTVDDLCSPSLSVGGSVSPEVLPVSIGGDVVCSATDSFEVVGGGVSVGAGAGTPVDAHASVSETKTEKKFNIFDFGKKCGIILWIF